MNNWLPGQFYLIHLSQYVSSITDIIKLAESKSALFMVKVIPVLFFFFLPCSRINQVPLYSESAEVSLAFNHRFSLQHLSGEVVSVSRKTERSHFSCASFPVELGYLYTTVSWWNQWGSSWGPWAVTSRWKRRVIESSEFADPSSYFRTRGYSRRGGGV